eukprot:TRINITY_DN9635_c0_g1_i1.p1 TRINITY_DN9635_c0_g1~~TRINITY_DN9635_c0_g1_i1.p1  ORF type:complete len:379 (-),score=65.93 TRINITY_DN9635_c0_g1_i1:111-1115(-)
MEGKLDTVSDAHERLQLKKDQLLLRVSSASALHLRSKLTFIAGVSNALFTAYLLGAFPAWFPIAYSVKAVLLITLRFLYYYHHNYHYFLLDFCYSANALCLLYLWYAPNSPALFYTIFAFANGPLLWSIPTWRNSMIFHELDKISSLFIHLDPALLLYALRFKIAQPLRYTVPESASLPALLLVPFAPYLVWQLLYWAKVYWLSAHKTDRMTSASFMLSEKKGFIYDLCAYPFGPARAKYGFMLLQLVYTLLTMLPTYFMYHSELLYVVIVVCITIWSTKNGADYYMEIFARRYHSNLAKQDAKIQHAEAVLKEKEAKLKDRISSRNGKRQHAE